MVKPTVISTFAGCGGSSLGYQLAGFHELLAVEFHPNAIACLKANFPGLKVHEGDIRELSAEKCMDLAGIKSGELDVFDGSPPCQGFSTAGKRDMNDSRNGLFKEYARLLRAIQPKVFVMENVTGMVKGAMKQIYLECIRELRDAWNGLPEQEAPELSDVLKRCAADMDAGNYSEAPTTIAFMRHKGKSSGAMNTKLLSWNRVSCTLVKSEIAGTGIIHPNRQRYLSIPEMKRLGSFPDDFQFVGERKMSVERIGNSVPPNLMRAIATHIKTLISA